MTLCVVSGRIRGACEESTLGKLSGQRKIGSLVRDLVS